ncbi:ATP-dependent nuclease [Natrinema sp. LN54]|uniref:ATP-dependent nuclease n=1 Tax=Natrinema sp. LN54 TaxID=3458705 RepID=UPI00403689F5
MQINKLTISGYKSIREPQTVEFGDLNVLLGENNVGKSSVIDALDDYRDIFPVANDTYSGWAHKRNTEKNPTGEITFELEFELDDEEHAKFCDQLTNYSLGANEVGRWRDSGYLKEITHRLVIRSSPRGHDHVTGESIMTTNFGDEEVYLRRGPLDEEGAEYLKFRTLPDINYTDERRIWRGLKDIMQSSIESWQFIDAFREPDDLQQARRELSLDKSGENLTRVLLTLRGEKGDEFQRISNKYADIMAGVKGIRASLSEDDKTTVVVDEEEYEDIGFELSEISAGSKEILTLITKIVLANGHTDLLLVEEPELHLHPAAEKEILDLIVEEVEGENGLQVLLSTHSSVFIHHLDVNNIYRINRQGDTEIEPTDSKTIGADLRELGYEYAGMLQSEAVVIVEGVTDKIALEKIGPKYGIDFDECNIGVLVMDGSSRMVEHSRPVARLLNIFNVPYLFVCDSDIGRHFADDDEQGIPDTPGAIEGRFYQWINDDSSDHSESAGASLEDVHAWEHIEIEHYLLADRVNIKQKYNQVDDGVIDEIADDEEIKPDKRLERICRRHYDLPEGVDSLDKPTEISELSQNTDIEELPAEFHDVMQRIAGLVDAEKTVRENRPDGDE